MDNNNCSIESRKGISHVAVSFDESLVYVTEVQGSLLCFDRGFGEKKFEIGEIRVGEV